MRLMTEVSLIGILLLGGCTGRTDTLNNRQSAPPERPPKVEAFAAGAKVGSQTVLPKGTSQITVRIQLLKGNKGDALSYRLLFGGTEIDTATLAKVDRDNLWGVRKGDIMTDVVYGHVFQNATEDARFASTPLSHSVAEGSENVYGLFGVKPPGSEFADGDYALEILYNESLCTRVTFGVAAR